MMMAVTLCYMMHADVSIPMSQTLLKGLICSLVAASAGHTPTPSKQCHTHTSIHQPLGNHMTHIVPYTAMKPGHSPALDHAYMMHAL